MLCGMSAAVMVGWFVHSAAIVQLHPSFEPMKFNTALLFFLSGLGLLYWTNMPRFVFICGSFIFLFSSFVLSQYIFRVNYGIDTFFVEPFIQIRTVYPGRFSPNTAVAFMLTGFALACLAL
jgi:hypothetical protein